MIDALGLPGFFLLHRDMLELAREVAAEVRGPDTARALLPPGRGRGSSVSSIVCYLTGLSHIDPIANKLFLGRFLNEELTALPDIDLDFPRDIREVLIPRVHDRYGREHSALVAAFPTFQLARRDPRARQGRSACRPARSSASRAGPSRCAIARRDGRRRGRARARARRPARAVARPRHAAARSRMTAAEWQAMVSGAGPGDPRQERPPADDARAMRLPGPLGLARPRSATRPTGCRATSPSTRAA